MIQQLLAVPFEGGIGAATRMQVPGADLLLLGVSIALLFATLGVGFALAMREGR